MASSLSAILAYERFPRDALLLDSGESGEEGSEPVSARLLGAGPWMGGYTHRTRKAKELYVSQGNARTMSPGKML